MEQKESKDEAIFDNFLIAGYSSPLFATVV